MDRRGKKLTYDPEPFINHYQDMGADRERGGGMKNRDGENLKKYSGPRVGESKIMTGLSGRG